MFYGWILPSFPYHWTAVEYALASLLWVLAFPSGPIWMILFFKLLEQPYAEQIRLGLLMAAVLFNWLFWYRSFNSAFTRIVEWYRTRGDSPTESRA